MANRYTIGSGNSNDPTIWDGGATVPVTGDRVLICAGHTVTLNATHVWGDDDISHALVTVNGVATYDSIHVAGTLKLSRTASSSLTCRGNIYGANAGAFDLGKSGDQIPSAFNHDLILSYSTTGGRVYGLYVEHGCLWDAWAATRNRITTVATAYSGGNIIVADATGWEVGNQIYLPGTRAVTSPDEAEVMTIAGTYTPGSTTVPLTAAPTYPHPAGCPVVNLNANVNVKAYSDTTGAAVCFASLHTAPVAKYRSMKYVAFRGCWARGYEPFSGSPNRGTTSYGTSSNTRGIQMADKGFYTTWSALSDVVHWYGGGNYGEVLCNHSYSDVYKPTDGGIPFVNCAAISKSVGEGFVFGKVATFDRCLTAGGHPLGSHSDTGGVVEDMVWKNGWIEIKGGAGANAAMLGSTSLNSKVQDTVFMGNPYMMFTVRIGSMEFIRCDVFSTFDAGAKNLVYDKSTGRATFTDCTFSANITPITSLYPYSAGSALLEFVNKNESLTAQETYQPNLITRRENTIKLNSSSSLNLSPVGPDKDADYVVLVPCNNGAAIRIVGNCQYDSAYDRGGAAYPPTVTISGLGITPVVYTASSSALNAFEPFNDGAGHDYLEATNSSGADGNFTVTFHTKAKKVVTNDATLSAVKQSTDGVRPAFKRTTGSFIADGWVPGDVLQSYGWTTAGNNYRGLTVYDVSATRMHLVWDGPADGLRDENNVAVAYLELIAGAATADAYFDGVPTKSPFVTKARFYDYVIDELNPSRILDTAITVSQATALGYAAKFNITGAAGQSDVAIVDNATFQQLNDYGKAWGCTTANFAYAMPLTSPVLGSLVALSNVTISTGKKLNGSGSLSMGTKTLATEFAGAIGYTYTGGTWAQAVSSPSFSGGTLTLGTAGVYPAFSMSAGQITFTATSAAWDLSAGQFSGAITLVNTSGAPITVAMPTPAGFTIVNTGVGAAAITVTSPTVSAPITWAAALAGTTVIVYNDTQAGYMLDGGSTVGGGGYTLPITLPHAHAAIGDTIRLRHCKIDKLAGELVGVLTASGLALIGSQSPDTIYNTWAIDGATCDQGNGGEFAADLTNIDIDITSGGAVSYSLKKRLGAWSKYLLTLPAGLDGFYGAFTLESVASIRQNIDIADVLLKKTSAGNVAFTDRDVRYYRSDFSLPYDPTGNAIFMDYEGVPFVVTTSDQAVNLATVQAGLDAQGYTTARAPKLDNADAAVSTRLATAGYTAPDNATVALMQKILRNKTVTDPNTGIMTVYDNDGVTPLFTGRVYEDAAGTQNYRGQGVERRERLA